MKSDNYKAKVLLIDEIHPVLTEKLSENKIFVDSHPEYGRQEVIENISTYDGVIVRSKILIDKEIVDCGKNLKFIARSGAGMDSIDTDYAQSKGIVCLNSPEGNRDAVGEHAIGLLLALFDKIAQADKEVRQGLWQREKNRGLEIGGKTIGIIGYGNMGQSFAKRLSGFDCKVLAYDKYRKDYGDKYATQASLEELKESCEVLSLHVPLTEETKYMADKDFIESFAKPFYLINTSRGKVCKLAHIVEKLKDRKLLGAAMDVLEYENFSNEMSNDNTAKQELQSLFALPNTVLTPHVAGWTVESYYKLSFFLAEKILSTLKGLQ